jgi:HD-like signal output (HDOD) protein
MLEVDNEHYNSIPVGFKRASLNAEISNILIIVETRDDYLIYKKYKDLIDVNTKQIVLVFTNSQIMAEFNSMDSINLMHKDIIGHLAGCLVKHSICDKKMMEETKAIRPEKIIKQIQNMLIQDKITLPVDTECSLKMLQVLDNEKITFKEIEQIAKNDPALYSGIIKMANSVYFSGAFGEIQELEKALVRVGMANVKIYLINYVNKSIASNKDLIFADEIAKSIEKSLLTASLCYALSDNFKVSSPVTMFSIGLMSYIGEILMFAALSDHFAGTEINSADMDDYITLTYNLGMLLSGKLLQKWKFSNDYILPIVNTGSLSSNKQMKETRILHLATNMQNYYKTGEKDSTLESALSNTSIKVSDAQLEKILSDAKEHLKNITAVLS